MKTLYFTLRYRYKPVSLTGSWCALNCKFCGGKYLVNMIHVIPGNFEKTVKELYDSGVRGLLLSGGFTRDGVLPIEPYMSEICAVREKLELIISAHLGLITNKDLLSKLQGLVDVVDYEFTLSSFIANYVRGFSFNVERYLEALARITEYLHVVPHIYVWYPEVTMEVLREELRSIDDLGLNEVTLLVYISPDVNYEPSKLAEKILKNVEYARTVFPGRLYMGCMRPGHIKPLVDLVLVEQGLVDRIANPYYKVLVEYPSEIYDACCSIPLTSKTREVFLVKRH